MDYPSSSSGPTAYSHGHHASVLASHGRRTAATSCAYVLDRVRPGTRVLDVGCGPGSVTLDLAERVGSTGQVVGVDFSAAAVEAAQVAARRRGDHRTRFRVADVRELDLGSATFDLVHAHQVLQHLGDPVGALREMARYCAPDGVVAVRDADYGAMTWFPEHEGLDRWRRTYCAAARASGAEPDAGRRLRSWALQAGLEVLDATSSTWTYATPESTRWWGTSQADRVRHSAFADRAATQGLGPQRVEQVALAWEQWGQEPDAWFCIPHGEVVAKPRA